VPVTRRCGLLEAIETMSVVRASLREHAATLANPAACTSAASP
jgi:hypothetical protein